jgi:hypothetical protein
MIEMRKENKMETLTVRKALALSAAVGLGWVLGSFLGSFIQYLLTTFALNPILARLVG